MSFKKVIFARLNKIKNKLNNNKPRDFDAKNMLLYL